MNKVILDTETSDLYDARIAQLSYIVLDDKDNVIKTFNQYFALDYISEGAQRVHGLSVEKLRVLSHGKSFGDVADQVRADIENTILICHNVNFDLPVLREEFVRANKGFISFAHEFCTMEFYKPILAIPHPTYGIKFPKLCEVVAHCGFDEERIIKLTNAIYGSEEQITYHDARYDTVCTYKIFKAIEKDQRHYA